MVRVRVSCWKGDSSPDRVYPSTPTSWGLYRVSEGGDSRKRVNEEWD